MKNASIIIIFFIFMIISISGCISNQNSAVILKKEYRIGDTAQNGTAKFTFINYTISNVSLESSPVYKTKPGYSFFIVEYSNNFSDPKNTSLLIMDTTNATHLPVFSVIETNSNKNTTKNLMYYSIPSDSKIIQLIVNFPNINENITFSV